MIYLFRCFGSLTEMKIQLIHMLIIRFIISVLFMISQNLMVEINIEEKYVIENTADHFHSIVNQMQMKLNYNICY